MSNFIFIFFLFFICLGLILLLYRNFLILLLLFDLLLLICALNFIFVASYYYSIDGFLYALIILNMAAIESIIGLGLLISFFKVRATLDINHFKKHY
jgi:NADH-quinone oxidoreductase subunit K